MPITLHQGSLKYKNQQGNFIDIDCIKGEDYVLTAQDKEDIAGMVDVPVSDVQVNGTSVVVDGVANVPIASADTYGVVRTGSVTVSGSTPSITALPGIQYVCGEVATLDITLPASGCIDVVFQSGSTPTVLTVTPQTGMTAEWANGFDSTSLEADTLYELNIKMVGTKCLGVAGSWT